MFIREIIIPESVSDKIWIKHHVENFEVHEIFHNHPRFVFREKGMTVKGEDLYTALGRTRAGRYLIIFFSYKLNEDALLVTARDMTKSERTYYAKLKS